MAHDPEELCTCSPGADDLCEYRMVADLVIDRLTPPDQDMAEVTVVCEAVERLAGYVEDLPCTCPPDVAPPEYGQVCGRCAVLGRRADKAEQR